MAGRYSAEFLPAFFELIAKIFIFKP